MIPRYSRPEMVALWSAPERLRRWRDVELAALEGMVAAGIAPAEALEQCRARAGDFDAGDVTRIEDIERTTKHDVIAFLTFMEERIGPAARWLHFGMTSSDVLDTALGMTLRDAADLLLAGVDRVMAAVKTRAFEHRRTVMMGRSHGIHAEPMSFGHKLAHLVRRAPAGAGAPGPRPGGHRGGEDLRRGGNLRPPAAGGRGARLPDPGPHPRARLQPDHPARPARRVLRGAGAARLQPREVRGGDPPPPAHRGARGRGALHRRAEGQLVDAAQAQPHPVREPHRAGPADARLRA